MKRESIAKISAVGITIALVAILLSQIEVSDVITTLAGIDSLYLIAGFVLYICSYFFRALRFHILLNKEVGLRDLFNIVCVHNMVNNILPARTGELSYIYLLKKLHNKKTGEGISTLLVARVFDFIIISFLFFISALVIRDLPDIVSKIIWAIVGLLMFVLLLFLALVFYDEVFIDIIRRFANRIGALRFSLVRYLLRKGVETVQGFKLIKSKKLFGYVFITSMIIWCFQYSMLYILASAMNISLAFWCMIFALTITFFTIVLPIQTVGGFGTIECGWALGFMILGISKEISITSGFGFHIVLLTFTVVLGTCGLVNMHRMGLSSIR